MTTKAIKRAFDELEVSEQANLLTELASSLAKALAAEDAADREVFSRRRREEPQALSWTSVREGLRRESRSARRGK